MVRRQTDGRTRRKARQVRFPFRLLATVVVLVLGALVIARTKNVPAHTIEAERMGSAVGQLAPDFELSDLGGRPVRLSDFRGRPVVLTFMQAECHSCRTSALDFQAAYEKYKDQDFMVLAVSQGDPPGAVGRFVARYQLDYPIVLDPTGAVGEQYDLLSIPTTYFIGPDGTIQDMVLGVVYQPWIEMNLTGLKNQKQP